MRFWLILGFLATLPAFGDRGAQIYAKHCLSCHGDKGQGVADEYDESLVGTKSITSLAKYIHRTMPEENEDAVVDKDAHLVAQYIHAAFYSPEAQAKIKPARKTLLRRTQPQHRRAITDIVQSFRGRPELGTENGLLGHYYHKEKMDDRKKKLAKRIDLGVDFDIEKDHGVDGIDPKAHAIFWTGSLLPKESGRYSFRATTPNGVRVFVNEMEREKFYGGETHRKTAFIDAWVSSGNQMRSVEASLFLLGGHPIP
ncbi:MAG: c-type cytochrome, partial [Akkermansiaceae bacterium]|nr:c-type cytochrome [Akkermansiaceae bacterium]